MRRRFSGVIDRLLANHLAMLTSRYRKDRLILVVVCFEFLCRLLETLWFGSGDWNQPTFCTVRGVVVVCTARFGALLVLALCRWIWFLGHSVGPIDDSNLVRASLGDEIPTVSVKLSGEGSQGDLSGYSNTRVEGGSEKDEKRGFRLGLSSGVYRILVEFKARHGNSIRDKRKERCSSYWQNGLRLSRKPGDEHINKFWIDGCSIPLKNSDSVQARHKCRLCGLMDSELQELVSFFSQPFLSLFAVMFVDWYHEDA
ncbi:hypothetical protein Bca101_081426 [Brassica carinata]